MLSQRFFEAKDLGTKAHEGKFWYAGLPYTAHLQAVQDNVEKFLENRKEEVTEEEFLNLLAAAWLHDAVEDAGTSLDLIEEKCGRDVRTLVWAVTDEPGANRKERHERTYPKIRNVPLATALKLADRIANVEASVQGRGEFFEMYRKEQYDFKRALYIPGKFKKMWDKLEALLSIDPSKRAGKLADRILAQVRSEISIEDEILVRLRPSVAGLIQADLNKE